MKKSLLSLIFATTINLCISQNVILHEDFSDCYSTIAIDEDNDVIALGTGLSSGGKLLLRTADGAKIDIEETNTNIGFQSVSAMYMSEADLYVAGYGAVAIIDIEDLNSAQMFTNNNSELRYPNEFSSIVYDYNKEIVYAGNPTVSTDVFMNGEWSLADNLKKITASTFDEELDLTILVSSSGLVYVDVDGDFFLLNDEIDGIPELPYSDASFGYIPEDDELSSLFLLARDNGFVVIDGDGNVNHYTSENSALFGGDLNCIKAGTTDGSLWIGHNGSLTKFKDGEFTFYNLLDELGGPTDINDIVIDNSNHLWLATCGGLVEFWEEPTATKNEKYSNFDVYPTINNGTFNVHGDRNEEISIYDIQGQMIKNIDIIKGDNNISTDLGTGIYLVSNQAGKTKKIIVTK